MLASTVDFETYRVAPGMVAPKAVCLAVRDDEPGKPGRGQLLRGAGMREGFMDALKADLVIGHNVAFDAVVAAAEWPDALGPIFDAYGAGRVRCTLVRQALIDVARGEAEFREVEGDDDEGPQTRKARRSLEELAQLWLGQKLDKAESPRLKYGELDAVPTEWWPAAARTYPLEDARATYRVWDMQELWASTDRGREWLSPKSGIWTENGLDPGPTLIPDELRQTETALCLQLMSSWGIRTDGEAVARLKAELKESVGAARAALQTAGLMREWGARDTAAIQDRVRRAYESTRRKVPMTAPSKRCPEGQIRTAKEVLEDSGDADLELLAAARTDMHSLSNYVPVLEAGAAHPLCTSFNPLLNSGRISSSKPNLNNPPRKGDVRQCFVPRPGYVFATCDYDTIELRALAQACIDRFGESSLALAFERDADPHLMMGAELLGIGFDEMLARYLAGDKEAALARQDSKPANFGFPGGLGVEGYIRYMRRQGQRITSDRSSHMKGVFLRTWSEMQKFYRAVSNMTARGEASIVTPRSGRARGRTAYCEMCNHLFQGPTSDGAKAALRAVSRECYLGHWEGNGRSRMHGSRPVIFMYDELIVEIPEDRRDPEVASSAARRLETVMQREMQAWLPDVKVKCGAVLMRRWHKGAKAVTDARGRLLPVRPVEKDGAVRWEPDMGEERMAA